MTHQVVDSLDIFFKGTKEECENWIKKNNKTGWNFIIEHINNTDGITVQELKESILRYLPNETKIFFEIEGKMHNLNAGNFIEKENLLIIKLN